MPSFRLDRRALLRGIGGVAVGLPALEIMGTGAAHAAGARRFVISYGGISTGTGRGDELVPLTIGRGYDVRRALKPLADPDLAIRDDVSVVTGLVLPWSATDAEPIPPGGRSRFFHFNTTGPLVAGTSTATARAGRPRGPTADQIVAAAIAGGTPHKVLAYRMQAVGSGDAGALSWRATATGPVRQDPIASPQLAYRSLFTGVTLPSDGAAPADVSRTQLLLRQRKSVLDFVRTDAAALQARLGPADRRRVQQHLDGIRALELRLESLPPAGAAKACKQPATPSADPAIGDRGNYAYSGEDQRADVLTDLITIAFACDLSRVASFLLTQWKCWMNARTFTGIDSDMHELTHGAGPLSSVSDSVAFLVRQWGKLVKKLKATAEPEGGTLLDKTALVLLFEGGWGFDPEANNRVSPHSTENMVALVAGRAGGLKAGHHVPAKGKHPAQVVLSAMNAAGVMAPALGEVRGNLPELFG
jgi:hypothetical protein